MADHFILHFAERRSGMREQVHAVEAQVPRVPHDVQKRDGAGPALRGVHPVARPRILGHIALAARPDVETVERVVQNRQPDSEQLEPEDKWEAGEKRNLIGVRAGAFRGESVGNEMLDQEEPDRNDARERMQSAQQK